MTIICRIEARFSRRPPSHFRFFRNPFSNVMWLLTSAHLFLIFVVFRLFHRLLFKHRDVAQWVGDDEGNRPLLSALWALGSVCLQSRYCMCFPLPSRPYLMRNNYFRLLRVAKGPVVENFIFGCLRHGIFVELVLRSRSDCSTLCERED